MDMLAANPTAAEVRGNLRRSVAALACQVCLALPMHASGQTPDIDTGPLFAGYAGLLMLASSPELSAGQYRVHDGEDRLRIRLVHVPVSMPLRDGDSRLELEPALGYVRAVQPLSLAPGEQIESTWSILGLGVGLRASHAISERWSLIGTIRPGIAWLRNDAEAAGSIARFVRDTLRGTVFDWSTWAVTAVATGGVEYRFAAGAWDASARGRIMHGWIKSMTDRPLLAFEETASIAAADIAASRPSTAPIFGRQFEWLARAGYFRNFGANRRALGYDAIAEIGGGVAWPIAGLRRRIALSMTVGVGDNVRSLSVGLSVQQ